MSLLSYLQLYLTLPITLILFFTALNKSSKKEYCFLRKSKYYSRYLVCFPGVNFSCWAIFVYNGSWILIYRCDYLLWVILNLSYSLPTNVKVVHHPPHYSFHWLVIYCWSLSDSSFLHFTVYLVIIDCYVIDPYVAQMIEKLWIVTLSHCKQCSNSSR